jgi:hypothetical protein
MAWLYVPASAGSNSGCSSHSGTSTGPSAGSSASPSLSVSSDGGCETACSTTHRSGTTSAPSTADPGVASWISSLRASRASRSASPASNSAKTTSATCGLKSLECLTKYDPASRSWRTCQGTFDWDSIGSSVTWPTSGSMHNGRCWERETWAHPSDGPAYGWWPTVVASDCRQSGRHTTATGAMNTGTSLTDAVRLWLRAMSQGVTSGGIAAADEPSTWWDTAHIHQDQPTPHGSTSQRSHQPRLLGQIQPLFAEWLAGVPHGWTGSEHLGMEYTRWLRLMRCELSRLESPTDPETNPTIQ